MSLTKRQKKVIIDSYTYLTVQELSQKLNIDDKAVIDYLKLNKKKPLLISNGKREISNGLMLSENKENKEDLGFIKVIKNNWKFLLLLGLGIFLIYFNSLRGDFVSDDYAAITQNPNVKSLSVTLKEFTLSSFSTYLLAVLFGTESSIPYHTYSVLLYILISVIAFVFMYIVFDKKTAVMSSVIFALLPIHTESVSWISGKPYLFNALFVLSSLLTLILYLKTNKKIYLLILGLLLPLTYFADRVRSFSLIFLIILYLLSFKEKSVKINIKKILLFSAIGAIIVAVIIWPLIQVRIQTVNSGYNQSDSIFYNPFFQYPTAITKYLQLMLFPTDLTLYHTMYTLPSWLNWSVIGLYLVNLVYFFFKDKRFFFALAFIFCAMAPSMSPVKVSWLVAERYAFLGSLGFSLFLALSLERIKGKLLLIRVAILAVVLSFFSIRIYLRNIDWRTNHNLWVNTVQVSPNSHNAWNNIGDDYDKLKQYDNAIKGFTQSTVVKPNYADAYHNRANIFYKTGRLDLARDSYETALKYSPGLFQTYFSLIQIDLTERKNDLALSHAQKLAQMQPNNPQVAYVLGVTYFQNGMKDEAKKVLTNLLNVYPQYKAAKDLYDSIK